MPPRERFEIATTPATSRAREFRSRGSGSDKFTTRTDQIVRAAVAPLNRHGLRGMTLAQVGERLGLAPTAVAYYFRRKEDLAAACYLSSLARLDRIVTEAATYGAAAPQALIRLFFEFRRRIDLGEEDDIAWFEDARTMHNAAVDAAYTEFFRRLRALMGSADTPAARVARNVRTHMFLSQIYWIVGWAPQYHPHDYGRMAERVIDILEHGLVAPGAVFETMSVFDPPADEGGDPRRMFLRAATDLINERGYLGASVEKISERLNLTKGAFYHHHEAKNDLVSQCFERTWRLVAEAQAAADAATPNGLVNLASVASDLVEQQLTGRTPLLRSAALAAIPADLRPPLIAGFNRTSLRLASVICDGIGDGSVRPVEAAVAAHMLSGAINSAAELHFWAPGVSAPAVTNLYVRPLFTGLITPARS